MYLASPPFLFRSHTVFKSPQINVMPIIVDVLLIIVCNMRYFKIIVLKPSQEIS